MAEWAYVENNEIVELHDILPVSWRNISGLRNAADNIEFLNSVGWYKVNKEVESYNSNTHQIIDFTHEFNNNAVIERYVITEIPPAQTVEVDPYIIKQNFMNNLRKRRDALLEECDYTQLSDVQLTMDSSHRQNWLNYRQQLRDLPSLYENVSVSTDDISIVNWPTLDLDAE